MSGFHWALSQKLSAAPPEGTQGNATLLLYTSSINEV